MCTEMGNSGMQVHAFMFSFGITELAVMLKVVIFQQVLQKLAYYSISTIRVLKSGASFPCVRHMQSDSLYKNFLLLWHCAFHV